MTEATLDKVKRAADLVAKGESVKKACATSGVSTNTYYYHFKKAKKANTSARMAKPRFIEFETAPLPTKKVAVLIMDAKDVKGLIGDLWE